MARSCFNVFLMFLGVLIHVDGGDVDKRLLDSDPNYLHNIEVKMQDMTQTIADLTQKYSDLAQSNSDLKQKYGDLSHANEDLSRKYADVLAQLTQQNQTNAAIQSAIGNQSHIYFDTHPSKVLGNFGSGQPIVFDSISNNVGNRYNPTTGQFVCDRPGVYVFYSRFRVKAGVELFTVIMKNGIKIEDMYTYNTGTWGHSATMIVHHLQAGDAIWVSIHPGQHPLSGDVLDNYDTSFAGFLLYPDYL